MKTKSIRGYLQFVNPEGKTCLRWPVDVHGNLGDLQVSVNCLDLRVEPEQISTALIRGAEMVRDRDDGDAYVVEEYYFLPDEIEGDTLEE